MKYMCLLATFILYLVYSVVDANQQQTCSSSAVINNKTSCEDNSMTIECSVGKIKINTANYGRTAKDVCPGHATNTYCYSPDSLNIVSKSCLNKTSCTISASNTVFGDPCVNTYKYLYVSYCCEEDTERLTTTTEIGISSSETAVTVPKQCQVSAPENKITCEHETLSMTCAKGKIKIFSANYGRTTTKVCTKGGLLTNTSCHAATSLSVVEKLCSNKKECSVAANNYVFGDPCYLTLKYLEVQYCCEEDTTSIVILDPTNKPTVELPKVCDPKLATEIISCHGTYMTIACENGVIDILSANYGRTSATYCPLGSTSNTSCYANQSLSIVESMCSNKTICTVFSSDKTFGDPCLWIFKYLEVHYCCIEGSTAIATKEPPKTIELPKVCDPKLAEVIISCHSTYMTIACEKGKIDIISANYGRTSPIYCLLGSTANMSCYANKSLSIVQRMCSNKTECTVYSSDKIFGDPCLYIYKYLEVHYCCIDDSTAIFPQESTKHPTTTDSDECDKSPRTESIACPGQALTLACETGVITILSANFGRKSPNICLGYGPVTNTSCSASNSMEIFSNICNNRKNCTIYPAYETFGDPCFLTTKYLEADYCCGTEKPTKCAISPPKDSISCNGQPLTLTCNLGTIKILSANYGRTSPKTCLGYGPVTNTSCSASNSLQIFTTMCSNKKSCTIYPSYEVFGDPCYLTTKYLESEYCCEKGLPTECNVSPPQDSRACTGQPLTLACKTGIIKILSANYGRTSADICLGYGPVTNTSCSTLHSFEIISAMCNNKNSCTIYPHFEVFGDPCYLTTKYLEATYCCEKETSTECAKSSPEEHVIRSCENHDLNVQCDKGFIDVVEAFYGRSTSFDCNSGSIEDDSSKSLEKVSAICNGKENCSISADDSVFGDPCLYHEKYLEVSYLCQDSTNPADNNPDPENTSRICQTNSLNIQCSNNGMIKILNATYARSTSVNCSDLSNSKEQDPTALSIAQKQCVNKKKCVISANNTVFTEDPCPNFSKYLEITYRCNETSVNNRQAHLRKHVGKPLPIYYENKNEESLKYASNAKVSHEKAFHHHPKVAYHKKYKKHDGLKHKSRIAAQKGHHESKHKKHHENKHKKSHDPIHNRKGKNNKRKDQ